VTVNDPLNWDSGLEGVTLRIAGTEHSPLRVLAGPGTGKTYSLMRRVARLLQSGADPSRILVVTFTRAPATDLKGALTQLGVPGASKVDAGTLHSFCFGLLERDEIFDVVQRVPRPLLEFEKRFSPLKKGQASSLWSSSSQSLSGSGYWGGASPWLATTRG
jgi:ATP-dependent DNA helicase UvrD/PcrA